MAPKVETKKRKATIPSAKTSKKPRTAEAPHLAPSKQPPSAEEPDEIHIEASDSESDPEDDQTAALLKGFESSSSENSDNEEDKNRPLDLSALPDPRSLTKNDALSKTSAETTGSTVIYLGRIPHGFYEHQMKAYFSQFGEITRLRLSRNRKTGASRHYAFIEFASPEVARIVAQTMNNYLMFKHILKVRLVPPDQVHPELWKGAGKRFKKVPWNRLDRARIATSDRKGWTQRVKAEEARRAKKAKKLRALGYEFEAPALRGVDDVSVKEAAGGAEILPLENEGDAEKPDGEKQVVAVADADLEMQQQESSNQPLVTAAKKKRKPKGP